MKQIISIALIICLALSVLCGCGCEKKGAGESGNPTQAAPAGDVQTPGNESNPPSENGETPAGEAESGRPAVSENKEVVTLDNAPKVMLIANPESNTDSITYHLESCTELEGKEAKEISWKMVQTIGFWQCPVCNPPRYEDYKNAQ